MAWVLLPYKRDGDAHCLSLGCKSWFLDSKLKGFQDRTPVSCYMYVNILNHQGLAFKVTH